MNGEDIPFGDEFEGAVRSFNKKAAGALASAFVRSLTNATEIFYRRDLGERFFAGAMSGGFMTWGIATAASFVTSGFVGGILRSFGFNTLAEIFGNCVPGVLLSGGMLLLFLQLANENAQRIRAFRNEGKTYHSMSRGVSRWGDSPQKILGITIGALIILVFLAPVTGVLFGISRYLSAQAVAKQEAAMYDRYLDAMDAKIEGELLQDALLGKCPPEVTYLYKPLPTNLKPELRENMAAAAAGKPVRIVAQAPKKSKTPTVSEESPLVQKATEQSSAFSDDSPASSKSADNAKATTENIAKIKENISTILGISVAFLCHPKLWALILSLGLLGAFSVCAVFGIRKIIEPKPKPVVTNVENKPQNFPEPRQVATIKGIKSAQQALTGTVSKPIVDELLASATTPEPSSSSLNPKDSSTDVVSAPLPVSSPKSPEPVSIQSSQTVTSIPPSDKQAEIERRQIAKGIEAMVQMIKDEGTKISQLKTNGNEILADKLSGTSFLASKRRKTIKATLNTLNNVANNQETAVRDWQKLLTILSNAPLSLVQRQLSEMTSNAQVMASQRTQMAAEVNAVKNLGGNASPLIQIR